MKNNGLVRFLEAQQNVYPKALSEIRNGKKETHWMWFIFPQIKGLGRTETAKFYSIENAEEAENYHFHPILGKNLIEISEALLQIDDKTALEIFGNPDAMKLNSCMTLFSTVSDADPVFKKVLDKYYDGNYDELTLNIVGQASDKS